MGHGENLGSGCGGRGSYGGGGGGSRGGYGGGDGGYKDLQVTLATMVAILVIAVGEAMVAVD